MDYLGEGSLLGKEKTDMNSAAGRRPEVLVLYFVWEYGFLKEGIHKWIYIWNSLALIYQLEHRHTWAYCSRFPAIHFKACLIDKIYI